MQIKRVNLGRPAVGIGRDIEVGLGVDDGGDKRGKGEPCVFFELDQNFGYITPRAARLLAVELLAIARDCEHVAQQRPPIPTNPYL